MSEVDQILWDEWDPIGVSDLPRDEYSSYVGPIVTLLLRKADYDEIAAHLEQIEKVTIRCSRGGDVRREVASLLTKIRLSD